ncbi:hypothetical protein KAR91_25275 [Candidatus Pacearchaeota archaeon]|nr:hypothetical protein [Candidatus Pacearchaeota archaeon]
MYVKIVKRKFETDTGLKNITYYYLAEKIRVGLKVKDRLVRKLNPNEITTFIENKESFLKNINSEEDYTTDSEITTEALSLISLKTKLEDLIDEINNKEEPFKKAYRPQKFSELFLVPLVNF